MRQVVLLTQEQKDQIQGRKFAPDSYFLPLEDIEGNWIISTVEQELCITLILIGSNNVPTLNTNPNPSQCQMKFLHRSNIYNKLWHLETDLD